jgi:hypothetical protein
MKEILMSDVRFAMQHANGNASIIVPVWYVLTYTLASMFWPIVAILALMR